eukprot:SAG11_NODE_2619_length_3169_cov_5.194788_4_plen_102_part_00
MGGGGEAAGGGTAAGGGAAAGGAAKQVEGKVPPQIARKRFPIYDKGKLAMLPPMEQDTIHRKTAQDAGAITLSDTESESGTEPPSPRTPTSDDDVDVDELF